VKWAGHVEGHLATPTWPHHTPQPGMEVICHNPRSNPPALLPIPATQIMDDHPPPKGLSSIMYVSEVTRRIMTNHIPRRELCQAWSTN
jgi:hypothetical protein